MTAKLQRSFFIFLSALCAAIFISTHAWAQTLPEPISDYVNDFAEALDEETKADLTTMLQQVRQDRDQEITVVTIKWRSTYGDYPDLAAFGKALFNHWGVGKADTNYGVMLLFALNDRQMRIVLGDGLRARYDGVAKRIIDSVILPQFEVGEMEAGILRGTEAAIERLTLGAPPPPEPSWWERLNGQISDLVPLLIFGLAALACTSNKWVPAITRVWRRIAPLKCPECSGKMLRLGDVQERQYLSDGQLLEEKLNSAKYDVWICPRDEHLTIKADYSLKSRYKACPDCGYHTCEVHRHTRRVATRSAPGEAEQAYRCGKCGYTNFAIVPVPFIEPNGSEHVSRRFGRSSGSGGSSGGFGGGSSSGGGASGSW